MSTEYKEIAIDVLHIHTEMGSALRSIHQYRHTMLMGNARYLLDRINRAKDIAYMGDAHQLGAPVEHTTEFIELKFTTLVHRDDPNGNATFCSLQLPWHDIGVMLHH